MYVCMYAVYSMAVCMYACMYVCMYVWLYVCMILHVCTCMYVCMYVWLYVCTLLVVVVGFVAMLDFSLSFSLSAPEAWRKEKEGGRRKIGKERKEREGETVRRIT